MVRYLTVEEVIALHDREVAAAVREPHTLASAVEQPQASAFGQDAYPSVHDKAAALLRGLASTQGFVDGNKRAALLAVYAFYGFNGYVLTADHTEVMHLILDVAVGTTTDVPKIASRLEVWALEIPDPPDVVER